MLYATFGLQAANEHFDVGISLIAQGNDMMNCILQRKDKVQAAFWAVTFCVGVLLGNTIPAHAIEMGSASPLQNITVMTPALPGTVSINSEFKGVSVTNIEHLSALEVDLVYLKLSNGQNPEQAVSILNAKFPAAKFELFEDFEMDEIGEPEDELIFN